MQLSLKDLNKKIAQLIDPRVELVRAEGYHYFQFDDVAANKFETESVMVPYLSQMSNDKWLDAAREFAAKHAPREEEVRTIGSFEYRKVKGAATPTHQKLAEEFRDDLLRRANEYKKPEHSPSVLKKFEVESDGRNLTFVTVEIGLENDEGTLASIFCRNYRHISIVGHGRRVRYQLLNAKLKKDRNGYWNCLHALTR